MTRPYNLSEAGRRSLVAHAKARSNSAAHRAESSVRFKKMNADPVFRANAIAAVKAWWADPANNILAALTPAQRAEYDRMKNAYHMTRQEALKAIKRADLMEDES